MKICVINGTNREGNNSLLISNLFADEIRTEGYESTLVDLSNFSELFNGKYISVENANDAQKDDIRKMSEARILVFCVPTYHHSIPAPLANFLDLLDSREAFDEKVIGMVATSGNTDSIRQAEQAINGILAYEEMLSFIVPKECILDWDNPDKERIRKFIKYLTRFVR